MPEGQFTGRRAAYLYTPDSGEDLYLIQTDESLGSLPGTGLVLATQTNTATAVTPPKRFEPRVVFWQGILNGRTVRKALICGSVSADFYDRDSPQGIVIDGVQGSTTGRKGERLSFLSLPVGGDPEPPGAVVPNG